MLKIIELETKKSKRKLEEPIIVERKKFKQDVVSVRENISFITKIKIESGFEIATGVVVEPSEKYCLGILQTQLNQTKEKINEIDDSTFNAARTASNPYELAGKGKFINRSAIKLANLDHLFHLVPKTDFKFLDLCGGPGGFAEYICWRASQSKIKVKGWGMTLHGEQDYSFNSENFYRLYGTDGTGDVCNIENIRDLAKKASLVQLVVADGSFNVKGDELYQEEHHQQLFLAQSLSMLLTLASGGNGVIKIFDSLLPFTVELIYILCSVFDKCCLIKPFSSRPANSERFLVLQGYSPNQLVNEHLETCLLEFNKHSKLLHSRTSSHRKKDAAFIPHNERKELGLMELIHIFDESLMLKDSKFINWIKDVNLKTCAKQKAALEELLSFAKEPEKLGYDQENIAKQCIKEWNL